MTTLTNRAHEWAVFLIGALVLGALTFLAATRFHTFPPWAVFLAVFILAVLIMFSGIYVATLQRLHENVLFNRSGWLYKLRSRRLLSVIRWFLWGASSAFFMLLQLNLYTQREWILFFLNFPLFYCVFLLCRGFLQKHVHPLHVTRFSITWTRAILPVAMAFISGAAIWQSDSPQPASTLKEIIAVKRSHMSSAPASSVVVNEALQIFSLVSGAQDYAINQVGAMSRALGKSLTVLSGLVVSFNACVLLACLVIPRGEYPRIFGPLSEDPVPRPPSPEQVASFTAIVTFVSLFVLLSGFAALEAHLRQSPIPRTIETTGKQVIDLVEQIAGQHYKKGTIAEIEKERAKLMQILAAAVPELDKAIDDAFSKMESNVDPYLDWYYGLPAEYARIWHTLAGDLETVIKEQLTAHLQRNDTFQAVETKIAAQVDRQKVAIAAFEAARAGILQSNRRDTAHTAYEIVGSMSAYELKFVPTPPVVVDTKTRVGGATVTGFVATKVTSKVVGKGILKLAAKGVSKLVVSKAANSAAGAAAGAAIGSVIPGVGTAIGAVSGFLIGLAAGIATDASLLKLEEVLSRDKFKKEILDSIKEAKQNFKAAVFAKQ